MAEGMKDFWDERLERETNLVGTGHRAFNLEYNRELYRMQRDTLDQLLSDNEIEMAGRRVLDIGSGTGFYVDYYRQNNAAHVTGLDITPTSVAHLQKTFPEEEFHCVDIGAVDTLPFAGPFDWVSVVSVIYHIVDPRAFEQAMTNICGAIAPGGYLLISDMFRTPRQLTPGHVRFRSDDVYQPIFDRFDMEVVDTLPMYYSMNRTFIPYVLPPLLGLQPVFRRLSRFDHRLRQDRATRGAGLTMLLAQKRGDVDGTT